jgi:hypothetical protein
MVDIERIEDLTIFTTLSSEGTSVVINCSRREDMLLVFNKLHNDTTNKGEVISAELLYDTLGADIPGYLRGEWFAIQAVYMDEMDDHQELVLTNKKNHLFSQKDIP